MEGMYTPAGIEAIGRAVGPWSALWRGRLLQTPQPAASYPADMRLRAARSDGAHYKRIARPHLVPSIAKKPDGVPAKNTL